MKGVCKLMREDKLQLRDNLLLKRIGVALLIVIAYVALSQLKLPGIHTGVLTKLLNQKSSQDLSLLMMLAGGNLTNGSVVLVGFMPFILVQMLLQVAQTGLIPPIKRMNESIGGAQKMGRLTVVLSTIVNFVTSYGLLTILDHTSHNKLIDPSYIIYSSVLVTAGSAILIYLAQMDTLYGLGNGLSFLIAIGVLTQLFESPQHFYVIQYQVIKNLHLTSEHQFWFLGIVLLLILNYVCYWFQTSLYKVPLQFAKLDSSLSRNGQMPFSLNVANVMPVIVTSMLMSFVTIIAKGQHWNNVVSLFNLQTVKSVGLFVVIIFLMSVITPVIQYYPGNISQNLSDNGNYVIGVAPGKETKHYLYRVLITLGLLSGLFYVIVVGGILLGCQHYHIDSSIAFGISSILIVLVSLVDISKQIQGLVTRKLHANLLN